MAAVADDIQTTYQCPMCKKLRMVRPKGYEVSAEKQTIKTKRGTELTIPKDVCSFCEQKIIKKHLMPSQEDIKKILETSHDEELDESLEDML